MPNARIFFILLHFLVAVFIMMLLISVIKVLRIYSCLKLLWDYTYSIFLFTLRCRE